MRRDDSLLDEILAGGRLGGPEYDRIFREVLKKSRRRSPGRVARWLRAVLGSAAFVTALGAWLLLARPARVPFTPKGGAAPPPAALDVGCAGALRHVCRRGSTLMIEVRGGTAPSYLVAVAEQQGTGPHQRIWYFPGSAGQCPRVDAGAQPSILAEGVRIGAEHLPGDYDVHVWMASRPLGRGELDGPGAGLIQSQATFRITVEP